MHLFGINTFECMKMHGLNVPKISKQGVSDGRLLAQSVHVIEEVDNLQPITASGLSNTTAK
jgi:hypothetical protein